MLSRSDIAARFESLGGGNMINRPWGFGCEFGFFQRSAAHQSVGLLKWASINPDDLIRGLTAGFEGIEDPVNLTTIEAGDEWGVIQAVYKIKLDHTGWKRASTSADAARTKIAKTLGRMRDKLLEDLAMGEKVFIYRTYDQPMSDATKATLASCVASYGRSVVCCVSIGDPPFTAVRRSNSLIEATIDRFAPVNNSLVFNNDGWEAVCRAILEVA